MEFVQIFTWTLLTLAFVLINISHTNCMPYSYDAYISPSGSIDRIDYDYYQPESKPVIKPRLDRLSRGYYYIDDGYITAVPESAVPAAHRRKDTFIEPDGTKVQYTPLLKYKVTRTKHKKLFVPNLFG